ncbi:MAG: AsmA-like C-terminal region-containing protein [Chthoniobacterales bacterium]
MKRITRALLIFAGAILALAAVIVIAVNLYVQSQATQLRIEQELSQRLGTPLRIKRMSVTPWGGLELSGITIPQTTPGVAGKFLEAQTFRLRIHFPSLFSRRLVVKEISLINPIVNWAQNDDGKWRLPSSLPEGGAARQPVNAQARQPHAPVSTPSTAPETAETAGAPGVAPTVSPLATNNGAPPQNPSGGSFVPEIRRVNLAGGRFHFYDQKAHVVAMFDNVTFRSNFRDTAAVRGNISIGKTSLRDRFFLEQLKSPLEYGPTQLDFSKITARAAGGEISGRFTMHPETEDSPFAVAVVFNALQADRLVAEAGGSPGVITGRVEGRLDASGKTADANALSGTGEIFLRDGEVRQYSILVALGQLTQIQELQQLHLDQAHVKYHIDPGTVTVDELLLRSPNIRLSATGTISFDGELRMDAQFALNEKIRRQLFRAIRDNFQPIEESGYSAINFQISGTIDRPRTDLMEKLVGRDLKDIGSAIKSLLGGMSERSKKKRRPEQSAAPAAIETATPSGEESAAPTQSPTPPSP